MDHKDIIKSENGFTVKRSFHAVKLPKNLTKNMCRFLGILHGDGNMSFKRIHVSDKSMPYHERIVQPLFKEIFGINMNLFHDKKRNTYYSHIKSSIVHRFLVEVLEVPDGAIRAKLSIPTYLRKATKTKKSEY
ncbi:MAG: hypothetical protein ACE5EK_10970, partial [Nitrospinales bacterium]